MRWVVPSARLLGIGWYFAVCVLIGVLAGRWLDGRFDTTPWLGLIGTLVGLALALYGGFRMLSDFMLKANRRSRPPGGTS